VLIPGAVRMREILLMPPSNPAQENWTGHMLAADEGRQISGIQDIGDTRVLGSFLATFIPQAKEALAETTGRGGGDGAHRGGQPPSARAIDVAPIFAGTAAAFADGSGELFMLGGTSPEYRRESNSLKSLPPRTRRPRSRLPRSCSIICAR